MKKVVCLLLSVLVCLGIFLPVSADSADSEVVKKLILTAKEKLPIDDTVMEFRNYYQNQTKYGNTYSLFWEAKDKNVYRNINVTLEEDGTVIEYYLYEDKGPTKQGFSKYGKEEAVEAARAFISSLVPDKLAETGAPEAERFSDGNYQVTFPRVHNDVPVSGNSLRCSVDSNTLKIQNFSTSWEELTFAEGNVITEEMARQAFSEKIGYELFYQIVSKDYENTAKLIYRSRYDEQLFIDALTGEAVDYSELMDLYRAEGSLKNEAAMDSIAGGSGGVSLSPEEQALVDRVSQMLSKEKADKIARKVSEFGITSAFKLEEYSISRQQTGDYVIRLWYRTPDQKDGNYRYKSVTLEAESGRIINFYGGGNNEKPLNKKELSRESLEQKANAFLEKNYPDELAEMTEKAYFNQERSGYEYQRLVNGTKVYNNGASVYYDLYTGELISFNLTWTKVDFPEVSAVKSLSEAHEFVLSEGKFALRYITVRGESGSEGILVYNLESQPVLDAKLLVPVDYRLNPVADETAPSYTDISGHYGKDRIEKLSEYNIFLPADENGALRPDEAISQQDFLLLLDRVVWNGRYATDVERLYQNLIRQGVLTAEEVAPEKAVERIDGIRWLLGILGYGDFVKIPGIFRCPFGDVPEEDLGVAAVAWGLKLVSGDGGSFYPGSVLRRGDALIIIYNYMQ